MPYFYKVTALTLQLILPDAMKVFPVYMNSLLKTPALVSSTELSTDDRSFYRFLVNAMGVEETQALLYPRLIPLVSYTHHLSHWHQTLSSRVHSFALSLSLSLSLSLALALALSLSLSAHYGCVQRGDPGSATLLRGAAQWVRHLPAGKRALHVPLAGTGLPARPHPEPLQCALSRPPVLRRGMAHCVCNIFLLYSKLITVLKIKN